MKKITKEQWLTALESGKYEQIQGALATTDGTCCLGVIVKLAGGEYVPRCEAPMQIGTQEFDSFNARDLLEGMNKEDAALAMTLNDNRHLDFPQIAAEFRTRWGMEKPKGEI